MTHLSTTDPRWEAIERRDASADAAFVFAVRTTRIYCRPSCPARRPRPDRVVIFNTADEAARAGFRACLRCRPDDRARSVDLVTGAAALIEERLEDGPCDVRDLGAALGVTGAHLSRVFKRATGVTPRQFAAVRRLERAKARLRAGTDVTTALYGAGFGSASRLYENDPLGMTPRTYSRGGAGMRIAYTIVDSSLGRLLIGTTERGVCAVALGDDDGSLDAFLRGEYPRADLLRDDRSLHPWAAATVRSVDGDPLRTDLPLDIRGTAFQHRVWAALRAVPAGETRSYGEIASSLGQPAAARAVARACATNPASILVPCHRAVRGDGRLAGYRWGIERKKALLERERREV